MIFLKLAATAISLAIAALGVLGIVAPAALLELARALLAPPGLYAAAALRIVFGALLMAVAGTTRIPKTLRVIGAFILLAGVLTPFLPTAWFGQVLERFSEHDLLLFRAVAMFPMLAGLLFAYAINAPATPRE